MYKILSCSTKYYMGIKNKITVVCQEFALWKAECTVFKQAKVSADVEFQTRNFLRLGWQGRTELGHVSNVTFKC